MKLESSKREQNSTLPSFPSFVRLRFEIPKARLATSKARPRSVCLRLSASCCLRVPSTKDKTDGFNDCDWRKTKILASHWIIF